jgi:importin subunit alpha-1
MFVSDFLLVFREEDLVVEVAWVLVYVTSMSDLHVTLLLNAGLLPPLLGCLASSEQLSLLTPVLRTLGNIVAGDNSKTDVVLSVGQSLPGNLFRKIII